MFRKKTKLMDYNLEMHNLLHLWSTPKRFGFYIQPTGVFFDDLHDFVFAQGGGKSRDPNDSAVKNNPAGWCPIPDTDGKQYHTNHDITWQTFMQYARSSGLESTPQAFYGMTKEQAKAVCLSIYNRNVNKYKSFTKSDGILALLFYTIWGTGNALYTLNRFKSETGVTLWEYEAKNGSRAAYDAFAYVRFKHLEAINTKNGTNYVGWYAGITNFWRVFSQYA